MFNTSSESTKQYNTHHEMVPGLSRYLTRYAKQIAFKIYFDCPGRRAYLSCQRSQ